MYLYHFGLRELPFTLTPNTNFYLGLEPHNEALAVLITALKTGEGFIKVVGEVGTGKTLTCRKLLNEIPEHFVTAYIPNPDLTSDGLRLSVAKELGLTFDASIGQHSLVDKINERLLELHHQGKKVVLLVDESQCLSESCLEAIRLLTNLETQSDKLLQVVLFGQPELDAKLNQSTLRQLKQRITFSYYLKPLDPNEMEAYICHRLAMAGYTYGLLFTKKAKKLLYKASGGLPRLLNILCHKGLMDAYGKGESSVSHKSIKNAILDTESAFQSKNNTAFYLGTFCILAFTAWLYWFLGVLS